MDAAIPDQTVLGTEEEGSDAKPWKGKCSSGCYHAKTDTKRCRCRCRGELHGRAQADRLNEKRIDEFL